MSFLILVTILIGNPLTAIAEEQPSVEPIKEAFVESPESPSEKEERRQQRQERRQAEKEKRRQQRRQQRQERRQQRKQKLEESVKESLKSPSQELPPQFLRLSDEIEDGVEDLGPLKDLTGTWVGKGWNMIAVPINSRRARNTVGCPGKTPKKPRENFCVEIMPYIETLTFTPIGAPVPNRGFPIDTFVVGLHYQQVVSDANTFQPLHIENGMWLLLDKEKKIVSRLSSIPHGNTLLAIGDSFDVEGNFQIPEIDGLPILDKPVLGYAAPYFTAEGVPPFNPSNPNKILQDIIDKQKLLETVILDVSTENEGGISNIPFIEKNADVSSFESTFWIEDVEDEAGNEFLQLQYSQTTNLDFIKDFTSEDPDKLIVWPHIDVATMVKQ
ncbi:heme-binding protein [Okeania sp. SIO1I7]|uniref:heme-binding protein n=1 Tax=Okeania sp. SIO1I7 TaxID=2607772 RepID=UPI0025E72944|nr:heme-binding protein [Okeania sp. SIO1I7]